MDLTLEKLHYDVNWQDEFKRKTVSPQEAEKIVKSRDYVVIPIPHEPSQLIEALAARHTRRPSQAIMQRHAAKLGALVITGRITTQAPIRR